MPITNTFDIAVPDGAVVNADQIDEQIRTAKVDISERLIDIGAVDFRTVAPAATLAMDHIRVKSAAGGIKDATLANDIVGWTAQRYVKMPSTPRCALYAASTGGFTGLAYANVAFSSEMYDTASMHDNAVNNSRITIPTGGDGYYRVKFSGRWVCSAGGSNYTLNTKLQKNALDPGPSVGFPIISVVRSTVATADAFYVEYSGTIALVAGDYLTLMHSGNNTFCSLTDIYFEVTFDN